MAITRTDLQNMMRASTQGAGREAGEVLAGAAREFGASNLAAKKLNEQIELNKQAMSLRERLAALQEREFNETLPLKKKQLQAEIDKTKQYMDYLNQTLGMKQKELDYTLGKEGRDFTRSLFGLGYGTPDEREEYLESQTGGVFSTGPGGQNLGTASVGGGVSSGSSFLGGSSNLRTVRDFQNAGIPIPGYNPGQRVYHPSSIPAGGSRRPMGPVNIYAAR